MLESSPRANRGASQPGDTILPEVPSQFGDYGHGVEPLGGAIPAEASTPPLRICPQRDTLTLSQAHRHPSQLNDLCFRYLESSGVWAEVLRGI
jgi:hypothetical protein